MVQQRKLMSIWSSQAMNPMMEVGEMTKYTEVNNGTDLFCVKGEIKRFKLS
jgi:hypothetical protein